MRSKIYWLVLLLLLFSFFTLQFSQAVLQDSQTMTNHGRIVPHIGIFFEYGAESGVLQPPWDVKLGSSPAYVVASSSIVRTGSYALKFYLPANADSDDGERRPSLYEHSVFNSEQPTPTEYYFSWWMYFTDSFSGSDGTWTGLGGIAVRYGIPSETWKYRQNMAFGFDPQTSKLYVRWDDVFNDQYEETFSDFILNSTYRNKWLHFQVYMKFGNSTNGAYKAWISNGEGYEELVKEYTNIATDPRGDARWSSQQCFFNYQPYGHYAKILVYQPYNEPSRTLYADDAVLSTTKVSDSYGLDYP